MRKIFVTCWIILCVALAMAQPKEIVADGKYIMSDGETPAYAEDRALDKAKRNAVEQAGVYIQSETRVENFELVRDEISCFAGGLIEVTVLEEKREYTMEQLVFYAKIKALVDAGDIEEIRAFVQDGRMIEEYQALKEDYQKLVEETEQLKQQLAALTDKQNPEVVEQRTVVIEKIKETEQRYQARRVYERGLVARSRGKRHGRLGNSEAERERYFHVAMRLDKNFANPVVQVAEIQSNKGDQQQADVYLSRAIKMNPNRVSRLMKHSRMKKKDDKWKKMIIKPNDGKNN